MRIKRVRRVPRLDFCGLILLASCGGGSGSDSPPATPGIQEPSPPTITYTGSRQPIVATQSNVAELAYRAFSLRSLVQTVEALWVDVPQVPVDNQQTQFGRYSGKVDLRAEVDRFGRGYAEAHFQDFSDNPGELVNGRYVQRLRPESGQPANVHYSVAGPGTIEFDNLAISQDSLTVNFLGIVRITGANSDSFDVNLMVSDGFSGETLYFENCTMRFSEVIVSNSPRPAVDIAGAVYEQGQGGIAFSSLGPIPDLGYAELAGYLVGGGGGGIELGTDGPVTHIRPISFAFVSVIMDLDDDGVPETAKRFTWPALAGEPIVESSVMQGPIANAGNGRAPAHDMSTNVHGLFSHDDDGDWLTLQWQLLARPPLSTVSVDDVSTRPFFEFTPDIPGDYVFGLRVSDGVAASETSVIIRNAPSESVDDVGEPVGGLEISLPVAVSTPILIDGRSAMSWPYNATTPFWSRTGFGFSSLDETGDPASTWLTVANEGLSEIRFRHNPQFTSGSGTTASLTLAVGPAIFETTIELAGDANAVDVHSFDFDGDGDQDLVLRVGLDGEERIMILLATPEGLVYGPDVPAGNGGIVHGDVNGDGLADILSAAADGLLLFMQAPDHSLLAPQSIGYPAYDCTLAQGAADIGLDDVNGDGMLDIITVMPCKDAIVSWEQQANGSFGAPSLLDFPDHRITGAAFGDLNGDGRTDVLVTLNAKSTAHLRGASILVSQPDGTLAEAHFIENTSVGEMGGAVGDVDNDGREDAVVVNRHEVILFRQQADGSLVASVVYSDPAGAGFQPAVSLVDMDGDGNKDLFLCDTSPGKRLLLQQPVGVFSLVLGPRCFHNDLEQAQLAASVDINNDGQIDLVTATEDARGAIDERAIVKVYLQGVHNYPVPVTD